MSSPQDSETERAALEKAREGIRLLSAGDYEGAIAACTEAIELDPGSLGARRTRAQAYRRLGRETEAEADLKRLGGRLGDEDTMARLVRGDRGTREITAGRIFGGIFGAIIGGNFGGNFGGIVGGIAGAIFGKVIKNKVIG